MDFRPMLNALCAGSEYIKRWPSNCLEDWLWQEDARIDMECSWRL